MRLDRHSGTGNRGLPKKGGAGGKGTWGAPGSELGVAGAPVDPQDPAYDSEEEAFVPPPPPPQEIFKKAIDPIITEYFVSGDKEEAARALLELNSPQFHHEFVKRLISLALDKHNHERELASSLLSRLYSDVIHHDKIEEGFVAVLERVGDLRVDIPQAPELVANFVARAVCDDLLAPAFLKPDTVDDELAKDTLANAAALTKGKHAAQHLAHIWGPGDGATSVKRIKENIDLLIEEYLLNHDVSEADRAIRELDAPSFHYQVVKRGLVICLDRKEGDRTRLLDLFAALLREGLLSDLQLARGFKVVVDTIDDIALDIPNARTVLHETATRAIGAGLLPETFRTALDGLVHAVQPAGAAAAAAAAPAAEAAGAPAAPAPASVSPAGGAEAAPAAST